jgi:hypothetical protein
MLSLLRIVVAPARLVIVAGRERALHAGWDNSWIKCAGENTDVRALSSLDFT